MSPDIVHVKNVFKKTYFGSSKNLPDNEPAKLQETQRFRIIVKPAVYIKVDCQKKSCEKQED